MSISANDEEEERPLIVEPAHPEPSRPYVSARAIAAGCLIGTLTILSNTYYGLQAGFNNQGDLTASLVGFASFKALSRVFGIPELSIYENILVTSASTASGSMPVTAGFVGMIPTLELVMTPADGGPLWFSGPQLLVWSFALAFFGLIFASLFHDRLIVRENLPWPGVRAFEALLDVLYGRDRRGVGGSRLIESSQGEVSRSDTPRDGQHATDKNDTTWLDQFRLLLRTAGVGLMITILMHFVPVLRQLPIFGSYLAEDYLWVVSTSPGYFGAGIIAGPTICLHMFAGAIFGWIALAAISKSYGWATGPADDWETGIRGWVTWVSLAALMADASMMLLRYMFEALNDIRKSTRPPKDSAGRSLVVTKTHGMAFVLSMSCCCVAVTWLIKSMTWYLVFLAVLLSLPMAYVGIRALAEADWNPQTGLVSQLVFAAIIAKSNPSAILINVVAAGIATSGAIQAGDLTFDFKIGFEVGVPPMSQLYAQIVGSAFGAFISAGIYRLYTSTYEMPSKLFPLPTSLLTITSAKLLRGQGLPPGAGPFALGVGIFFSFASLIKARYASRWWNILIPNGISFAIGMYLVPSFTISRAVGGVLVWYLVNQRGMAKDPILIAGSGLVLGESIGSIVNLLLEVLKVPTF